MYAYAAFDTEVSVLTQDFRTRVDPPLLASPAVAGLMSH